MKKSILTLLLVLLWTNISFCQNIDEIAYLPHADSLLASDFKTLYPYLKNEKLILIGEANHGSHEFYRVKRALIEYLAEELDLKDVVIEANFANCIRINEYVTWQSEGNPEDLAKLIYVWPYRTEEFVSIISWMREFNKNKEEKDQIKLWGMDMQQAYPALKILQKEVVQATDKKVLSFPEFESKMDEIKYSVDDSTLDTLSQLVNSVSSEKKLMLDRCLEISRMQKKFLYLYQHGGGSIGQYRDSCMAENIKWIYDGLKKNSKILVWAHNSHIQKINQSSMRKFSMGYYIYKWYEKDTFYIGFDFNKGTYICPHPNKKLMTVSEDERQYFARLLDTKEYDLCFIPFTKTNQLVLTDAVGMRYNQGLIREKYTDLYDAVFFVNEVTPTKVLN